MTKEKYNFSSRQDVCYFFLAFAIGYGIVLPPIFWLMADMTLRQEILTYLIAVFLSEAITMIGVCLENRYECECGEEKNKN